MRPSLIIHGGAGSMSRVKAERAEAYRSGLREAARTGSMVLDAGGTALEGAMAAVQAMEASGVFNAGLGSCLTSEGTVEMDAAVMNGADRGFGAVAGVPLVAHPVVLAHRVMTATPHSLLGSEGALRFARQQGLEIREDFPSKARISEWSRKKEQLAALVQAQPGVGLDSLKEQVASLGGGVFGEGEESVEEELPIGLRDTVGAVAFDRNGDLAAAVSTGGIWMKLPGRIGDSPLPGAGLWAVNEGGAAVATGTGEAILRVLLCREVVDRMDEGPRLACERGIGLLESCFGPGSGGVIAMDPQGRAGFEFNTAGMGRALWREGMDEPAAGIWPGEDWDRPVPD